jgi:hypothetical protein
MERDFRNIRHKFANEIELYKDDFCVLAGKIDLCMWRCNLNGER